MAYRPFHLEIHTPQRTFYNGDSEALIFRSHDGEACILKDHAPMVASLVPGRIRFKIGGEWTEIANSDGMVEARPDGVFVFAQTVELPEEIDKNKALAKKEMLEEQMRQARSMNEYRLFQLELAKQLARLSVSGKPSNIK
jgi:F-type H+-transporting ATPase subunit epsilon